MVDNMNYLGFGKDVLKKVLDRGAEEGEICLASSREITVSYEKNDLQLVKSNEVKGVGIRAFKGGGVGFASSNEMSSKEINECLKNAVSIADLSPSDPANRLPEPRTVARVKGIYDPSGENFSMSDAMDYARRLVMTARDFDSRITIDNAIFSFNVSHSAVVNSKGIECDEKRTNFQYVIFGMAVDGKEVSSFDYRFDGTHFVKDINVEKVAMEFAKNVIGSLGATTCESFNGSVILTPYAAAEILGMPLTFSINSDNVQKNRSKFKDMLNKTVASPILTVEDNGTLEGGIASSSFDREGLPHKVLKVIENGKLTTYLYNTYTASNEGIASTGHARGGYSSIPSVGPTNFIVKSGKYGIEDMVKGTKMAVIVNRFSGNVDPISGKFSGVVKGGKLIENGEYIKPLTGTLISGNVYEALNNISAISSETERVENFIFPYIKLENISVTSG
ncbi:MAG: TldD/PmbA family protein [Thermotogae bacterium]|nr:TldD/PmbA family protein [Thermotogota bacterium]